mgnify:CR=1 FL=1
MQVVIPLFPQFTALDGIGPYEVLQRIPSIDVTFIGHACGEIRSENGFLGITADGTFEDFPRPDVIVFPGGVGTRPLVHDERVVEWLRHAHETTLFTTSVCTGSIVLGAAGLLTGLTATTHWSCYPELEAQGALPTAQRVVEHLDQRVITAAGVSSGIDMALRLVELLVDRTAAEQTIIQRHAKAVFLAQALQHLGSFTCNIGTLDTRTPYYGRSIFADAYILSCRFNFNVIGTHCAHIVT